MDDVARLIRVVIYDVIYDRPSRTGSAIDATMELPFAAVGHATHKPY